MIKNQNQNKYKKGDGQACIQTIKQKAIRISDSLACEGCKQIRASVDEIEAVSENPREEGGGGSN